MIIQPFIFELNMIDTIQTQIDGQYEERITVFIDLLGFKQIIKNTDTDDVAHNLNATQSLLEVYQSIDKNLQSHLRDIIDNVEVSQFSDCITISLPPYEKDTFFYLALALVHFQFDIFNKHSILLRGGITLGNLYHKNNILFGPAMTRAYELESQQALYPRIIIDNVIFEKYFQKIENATTKFEAYDLIYEQEELLKDHKTSILKEDYDGFMYIDYINATYTELDEPEAMFKTYIEALATYIQSNNHESIAHKMGWIKEKIQPALTHYNLN